MRYFRIFLLQLQEVIEDRSRIVVFFLLGAVGPLILILFWRGASTIPGWTTTEITSYYLLSIVIYAAVMCHQEDHIGTVDIQEGGLTAYLLKPFSYFKLIFFNEVCYRVIQGVLGSIVLTLFVLIAPGMFVFADSLIVLLLSSLLLVGAFALTFVAKMCMGLLAFWMTEARGAFEAMNVLIVIFAGVLLPLSLLPEWLEKISYVLPFAYMIYFPVIAFEGRLTVPELLLIFGGQMLWLTVAYLIYRHLWKAGLKKYTAVGQ